MEYRINETDGERIQDAHLKAARLIIKASELHMNLDGYGELACNFQSGNVYLWLEDYSFTLYIALKTPHLIRALYSCPYDGEEESIIIDGMTVNDQRDKYGYPDSSVRIEPLTHKEIQKWVDKLVKKSEEKESNQ